MQDVRYLCDQRNCHFSVTLLPFPISLTLRLHVFGLFRRRLVDLLNCSGFEGNVSVRGVISLWRQLPLPFGELRYDEGLLTGLSQPAIPAI